MSVSIRAKLALLAGAPVVGALLLALLVSNDARKSAASAASLGSIQDLAYLTSSIAELLHAVEDERAATAIAVGARAASPPKNRAGAVAEAGRATDAAAERLEAFLSTRDRSKLPPRLDRGMRLTEGALRGLPALRARVDQENVGLEVLLAPYRGASQGLISATAALAELSDDGDMLRSISAVAALLELEERASIEHAVVGYAAARGEFPPGAYKALVTTTTEESVYEQAFRTNASDDVLRSFEAARQRGGRSRELLDEVLKSTESTVSLDPDAWNESRGDAMRQLRVAEGVLRDRIESAAASKGAELTRAVRLSLGVVVGVILSSLTMAVLVARGIQGSVGALTDAAKNVRRSRDYAVRARKVSDDELGLLTDTFNEMLGGIQSREAELEQHRSHLEGMVVARTKELATRNAAMRLVLDTVDQGLATIGVDGTLHSERSRAFDEWFRTSSDSPTLYEALLPEDARLALLLKVGWEQVVDGILPTEVSLAQLPRRFDKGDRHFTLALKPILLGDVVTGALVLVSDVTSELDALREQARQREEIQIFRRIAADKAAFVAFLDETGSLLERLRSSGSLGASEQLALVHTVKGNAAQCEAHSVADEAHELESLIVDVHAPLGETELGRLFRAWDALRAQVQPLIGENESTLELSRDELAQLVELVRTGVPASQLVARLEMLADEPLAVRFTRLGEQASRLAARLGKPAPIVTVEANGLRLPRARFGKLWSGLVHVVRNAVDHGIEPPGVRVSGGKAAAGTLSFRSRIENASVVVEVADDGAGIDWTLVAAKAKVAGIPASGPRDLERALFISGLSTAEIVTTTSGRGVGLAATWDTLVELGGTVSVESQRGRGATFVFRVPLQHVRDVSAG